jgi:branched-chain amino acid transport system permease protein
MIRLLILRGIRTRYFSADYGQDIQIIRTLFKKVCLVVFLLSLFIFPLFSDRYIIYIVSLVLVAVIGSIGLNLLTGYTGQISIGHGAFLAIGAYSYTILFRNFGLPFWLSIIAAGGISGALGVMIGLPALRMKGLYLAMATLAFHFIIEQTIMNWEGLTGGYQGLDVPVASLGGLRFKDETSIYYLILFFAIALTFIGINIVRSKIGRAFMAIRDRDIAAEAIGISLTYYKLISFCISSIYGGIAGALMAICLGRISPYDFSLILAITYISMVIVGGLGSILGSILGAIAITLLPFGLSTCSDIIQPYYPAVATKFADIKTLVYGLVIVVFLMWEPDGLAGRWRRIRVYFNNWPFTY